MSQSKRKHEEDQVEIVKRVRLQAVDKKCYLALAKSYFDRDKDEFENFEYDERLLLNVLQQGPLIVEDIWQVLHWASVRFRREVVDGRGSSTRARRIWPSIQKRLDARSWEKDLASLVERGFIIELPGHLAHPIQFFWDAKDIAESDEESEEMILLRQLYDTCYSYKMLPKINLGDDVPGICNDLETTRETLYKAFDHGFFRCLFTFDRPIFSVC